VVLLQAREFLPTQSSVRSLSQEKYSASGGRRGRRRKAASKRRSWKTGDSPGAPGTQSVGTTADHSLDITRVRVLEHASQHRRSRTGCLSPARGRSGSRVRRSGAAWDRSPVRPHDRQAASPRRRLDRVEPVIGPVHHEQGHIGELPHPLHHHDRVIRRERHERASLAAGSAVAASAAAASAVAARGPGRGGPRSGASSGQVVAVGKLPQALQVELAEKGQLGVGQRGRAEVNNGGCGRLVVGHAASRTPGGPRPSAAGRCASAAGAA